MELFGWPVPELMDSSSEAKRVCCDVTSAISWSHGDGVVILPALLGVDLRPGEPGVGADVGLAEAVGMIQAAEDGEVVAMLLQRLQRRRELDSRGPALVTCQVMPFTPLGI